MAPSTASRSLLGCAISQVRSDDDAGTDFLFASSSYTICYATLGVADEIGNDGGSRRATIQAAYSSHMSHFCEISYFLVHSTR
jgi:hypothetical protein